MVQQTITHMKRKNQHYRLLAVISLVFWLVCIAGCNSPFQNENPYLFADYDFFTRQGIKKLKSEDLGAYNRDKKPYVELKYKGEELDSLILFNILEIPYYIKTESHKKNTLYEVTVRDEIFGDRKSVLFFKDTTVLEHYIILSQEPYVDSTLDGQKIEITKNRGTITIGRIKQTDTANFYNKLMFNDSIPIYKIAKVTPTNKRINKKLTLVNYLQNKF